MNSHRESRGFNIGQNIRKLRKEARLKLQDLSDSPDFSKPLLSQIGNNQVIPPAATLLKIAKNLKVGIHNHVSTLQHKSRSCCWPQRKINIQRR